MSFPASAKDKKLIAKDKVSKETTVVETTEEVEATAPAPVAAAPAAPSSSGVQRRYLQLNLLEYRWLRSRSKLSSITGNDFNLPSDSQFLGVESADRMVLGLYGNDYYTHVGMTGGFNYDLVLGMHAEVFEAGLELDYTRSTGKSATLVNGAEITAKTYSLTYKTGLVAFFTPKMGAADIKVGGRIGYNATHNETDDKVTSNGKGMYMGVEGQYANPIDLLGAKVDCVHGVSYLYSRMNTATATVGLAPDSDKNLSTQHLWTVNLIGLRLNF